MEQREINFHSGSSPVASGWGVIYLHKGRDSLGKDASNDNDTNILGHSSIADRLLFHLVSPSLPR